MKKPEKRFLKNYLKITFEGNFDYRKLAKLTPGFVGADLQGLVSAAGIAAIKRIFGIILSNSKMPDIIDSQKDILDTESEKNGEAEDIVMEEASDLTEPVVSLQKLLLI